MNNKEKYVIETNLSTKANQLIHMAINQIKLSDDPTSLCVISNEELMNILEGDKDDIQATIAGVLNEIITNPVSIRYTSRGRKTIINWTSVCEYDVVQGAIIEINSRLKPYLYKDL